jgi:hypothetical protein
MATNVFFNGAVKSEQDMYEDLIIESISIYGQDIIYIPRSEITKDEILNESYSKFEDGYTVEMYIENIDSFEGEGDLLSKFGIEIRDQATFVVAKRRWEKQVGVHDPDVRPMEGDLLYLSTSNSLFEIKFVEHEQPFYQLQNLPVYKLQAELFEYSDETLDTGIDAVDSIETRFATSYVYALSNGSGDYTIGETVLQWTGVNDGDGAPINIEGEVAAWEDTGLSSGNLTVVSHVTSDGLFKEFYVSTDASKEIVGTESAASYEVTTVVTTESSFNADPLAANDYFELEGDLIIDFTEDNPFGMP